MKKIYVAAPATDESAISYLFDNLDLIIANKNKILFHKKYRHIKIPGFYAGGLYVGMYDLLLGDILKLWDKTEWHTENKYYYSIIGTPLSGMNTAHWYNTETKKFESGTYFNGKLHFLGLAGPALQYLQSNKITKKETKILPAGCTTKKRPSNLSIFDLVKQLQR